MHLLLSATGLQKRVTVELFIDAGDPLASTFLMTLVNECLLGCPVEHHSMVGLLSSQNIFNPVCPCPWVFLVSSSTVCHCS